MLPPVSSKGDILHNYHNINPRKLTLVQHRDYLDSTRYTCTYLGGVGSMQVYHTRTFM